MKIRIRLLFLFCAPMYILMLLLSSPAFSDQFPDCLQCHIHKNKAAGKYVHPAYKQGCYSCHTEAHHIGAKFPKFLFAKGTDLCWGCHDKSKFTKKYGHPPVVRGECLSCHDVHTSDNKKLLYSPIPDLCFNCHDKAKFTNKSIHPPVKEGKCTACHDPHSSNSKKLLLADPPDLCFLCHKKDKYISAASNKHHAPVARGMCTSCHDPHASAFQKLLVADVPNLCFNCHEASDFQGRYSHSPVAAGMCMSCHEPHQGHAKKLLIDRPPDLCFNCHDKAEFTRANQHPPVSAGMCTVCHAIHGSPYQSMLLMPTTDGCLQCHPRIAAAPHAAGGFSEAGHPLKDRKYAKAKDGELSCASCHNPHSSDSMKLFRFPVKKPFDLCVNCHTNQKKKR